MSRYFNYRRIEFWIILFFVIRLIGITNHPLESGHNWRQVTGLMVARNYLETDHNLFFPRVDETNGQTGIIAMEFPVINYLIYLLSLAFGYHDWYGRLLNLIISSIGIFYFYRIISKYIDKKVAFFSTLALLGSIWFAFSRKTMPDTICISLFSIALYYGLTYLIEGRIVNLLLYFILGGLGILIKIPAGIYLSVFLIPFFSKEVSKSRKTIWLFFTLVILSLTYWWYFIWNVKLSADYGNWYNSGVSIAEGAKDLLLHINQAAERFYFNAFYGYVFFACFITGLFTSIVKRNHRILLIFGLTFFTFLIYIFKSGFFFYHHNYYIIPFVPVMALLAGYTITFINKKWVYVTVISAGIGESILNQQHDFYIRDKEKYKLNLEAIADSVTKPDDLIVINGNGNPQQLYFSHRKGWVCSDKDSSDSLFLSKLRAEGCKFVFVNKHSTSPNLNYAQVYSDKDYKVYRLGN